jgi:hypothetical protein
MNEGINLKNAFEQQMDTDAKDWRKMNPSSGG